MARKTIFPSPAPQHRGRESARFAGLRDRVARSGIAARRLRTRAKASLGLALLTCVFISCATLQAPMRAPTFAREQMRHTVRDGIEISVRPIVGEDEYLDLFDDDLPGIGMVAVWIEIRNARADTIHLRPDAWSLRAGVHSVSPMSVSEVYERYYEGRRMRMYSVQTDSAARTRMEKTLLAEGRVPPSDTRRGFLLFRIDPAAASGWSSGAVLVARDILLDSGTATTMEIALSHANP